MNSESRPRRLYLLWFFAAALALLALSIEIYRSGTFNLMGAILGGVCVMMGWLNMRRGSKDARDGEGSTET
jgi:hypothetical protein